MRRPGVELILVVPGAIVVFATQRAALIGERGAGRVDEEAVRTMLDRLDRQEAGVSARLESRF